MLFLSTNLFQCEKITLKTIQDSSGECVLWIFTQYHQKCGWCTNELRSHHRIMLKCALVFLADRSLHRLSGRLSWKKKETFILDFLFPAVCLFPYSIKKYYTVRLGWYIDLGLQILWNRIRIWSRCLAILYSLFPWPSQWIFYSGVLLCNILIVITVIEFNQTLSPSVIITISIFATQPLEINLLFASYDVPP